jgi:hypothetical protein
MRTISRINVHVRLPRGLHERAAEVAAQQDVSLNGLIVALLADKLGYDVLPQDSATPHDDVPALAREDDPPEANAASQLLDTVADALAQLRALVERPVDAAIASEA